MFSSFKSKIIIILILATPLISLSFSNKGFDSPILQTNFHNSDLTNTLDTTSNEVNGLLWNSVSGLTGDITTPLVLGYTNTSELKEIVYIGTEISLTKIDIETGLIDWIHATPGAILSITPIDDINDDGINDVLITIDNQLFNNTLMIDGSTSETIWSFRPQEEVWVEGIGYSKEETRSWSGLQIDDIDDDNLDDVLVSSYKTIYALSSVDGSLLWKFSATNDVWSTVLIDDVNADGIDEIAIGSQDGELILLDGLEGLAVWTIQASEPARVVDAQGIEYVYDRSVFDVRRCLDMNNDGFNDILITDENGYCAVFSVTDGQLIDRVKVYSSSGGISNQASFGDDGFYNLISMETDTNYATPKILTSGRSTSSIGNNSLHLLSLNQNNIGVDWGIYSLDMENIRSIATCVTSDLTGDYTKMIIPLGESGSSNLNKTLAIYSVENRSQIAEWYISVFSEKMDFELNFGDSQSDNYAFRGNYASFVNDYSGSNESEVLVFFQGSGLFLLDGDTGDIIWRQSLTTNTKIESFYDVNNDSTIDILSKDTLFPDDYQENRFFIPKICMIDGTSGELLWKHEIPYEDQKYTNGGYLQVITTDDATNDSIPDLLLVQQEESSFEANLQNYSKVKLLDGSNGTVIWETLPTNHSWVYYKEQLRINNVETIDDQDGDNVTDVLISCQHSYIYCRSGATGEYLWNITREAFFLDPNYRYWIPWYAKIVNVGQVFGNYTDDYVCVGDGRVALVDSDNFQTVLWEWFNPLGWLDEQYFKIHVNVVKNETFVVLSTNKNDKQYTTFINLLDGSVAAEIPGDMNQWDMQLFVDDFNDDDIRDHLMFRPWGNDDLSEGVYIISGSDGSIISYYSPYKQNFEYNYWIVDQLFRIGMDSFVDIIEDQNGDNVPEVIVSWSVGQHSEEEDAQGMVVELLDMTKPQAEIVQYYDFVKVKKEEWSKPSSIPSLYTKNLGDITDDGNPEILLTLVEPLGDIVSIILDISEDGGIWKEISSTIFSSISPQDLDGSLANNFVYTDFNGRIRAVDNSYTVAIEYFDAVREGAGKYLIQWESDAENVITTIIVDGEKVATVFDTEAEIYLSNGNHSISVAITDSNGISAFANMNTTIEKVGGVFIIWIVIIVVIISFIGVKLFFRFKRKEDLADFGPDLSEKGDFE